MEHFLFLASAIAWAKREACGPCCFRAMRHAAADIVTRYEWSPESQSLYEIDTGVPARRLVIQGHPNRFMLCRSKKATA